MFRRSLLLMLGSTALFAGRWEVGVDYLYWKVLSVSLPWARTGFRAAPTGVANASGRIRLLSADYQSGVRARAFYSCGVDRMSFLARYNWVRNTGSARFQLQAPDNLLAILGQFSDGAPPTGSVGRARITVPYHSADFIVGSPSWCCRCVAVSGLAAIQFVSYQRNYRATLSNLAFPCDGGSRFIGAGPALGFLATSRPWNCLDLHGELLLAKVIGGVRNTIAGQFVVTSPPGIAIRYAVPNFSSHVLGTTLRMGGEFHWRWQSACVSVDLGWESRYYRGAKLVEFNLGRSADVFFISAISFGGPYLGASLTY